VRRVSGPRIDGQEHRVSISHGKIACFAFLHNELLVEQDRRILLQDPRMLFLAYA